MGKYKHTITLVIEHKSKYRQVILYLTAVSPLPIVKQIQAMKLEDIDQLFKNNERQFDQMPGEQIWARLEQRLAEQPVAGAPEVGKELPQKQFRLRGFWRYAAAAVLVLVVLSPVALYFLGITQKSYQQMAVKTATEQPANIELIKPADSASNSAQVYTEESSLLRSAEADNYPDERNKPAAANQTPDAITYSANSSASNTAATATKTSAAKPEMPEVKQRSAPAGQPPATVTFVPPPTYTLPQPQRSQNVASGINTSEGNTMAKHPLHEDVMSKSATVIPPVNPPLADLAYSRYYIGLAQEGLQEKEQNLPKGNTSYDYNAAPPVTNNSGKPFMAPADATRDKTKTTTQKKQSTKQIAPAAGSKDDAPAGITLAGIAWLWGTWKTTQNNTIITEKWQPSGKADISSMVNGNILFAETAAMKTSGKGLVYNMFNPQTGSSATYQLSAYATINNLIFENTDSSGTYPGTIAYHLVSNNTLYVTFTGLNQNGQLLQTTLLYQKTE